jgi:hypothetical protein
MQQRVEKQTGVQGPKQPKAPMKAGLPGNMGTVGTGNATVGPGAASMVVPGKMKMAAGPMADLPSMKPLLGGGETVKPGMEIVKKPKVPMIRYASEYPSVQDCRSALGLDVRDGMARVMTKEGQKARLMEIIATVRQLETSKDLSEKLACVVRLAELKKEAWAGALLRGVGRVAKSPLFWGGAGLLGAGLGVKKMMNAASGTVNNSQSQRAQAVNIAENPGQMGGGGGGGGY